MAKKQTIEIDLGIIRIDSTGREEKAVLELETDKNLRGGLDSDAKVMWHSYRCRSHMFGLSGGGDFSRTVKRTDGVRGTQKAINVQHASVFTAEVIAGLVTDAKAHYAAYVEAGVDGMHNTYPTVVTA